MKKKVIINDFIINEKVCNFKCKYCLSNDLPDAEKEYINTVNSALNGELDVVEKAMIVLDIYESYMDADVLQISGGEVFLNEGILRLITKKSEKYKYVYILTNGYLIDEHIASILSDVGNVIIGISLDGHTLDMNSYRFNNHNTFDVIVKNMDLLYQNSIPIIVNPVIHNRNTKNLHEFLAYLANVFPGVGVFPIALRGEGVKKFKPSIDDLHILNDIASDDGLQNRLRVLPIYFEELYKAMTGMPNTRRCMVPNFTTELFDSGALFPCPLFWIGGLGNIISEPPSEIFEKIRGNKIYSILTKHSGFIPFCRDCFTSYSLFNLYLTGAISENQLKVVPYLDYNEIGMNIQHIAKNIDY